MVALPSGCHPSSASPVLSTSPSLAVVGKGGVGKTTIAAFMVRYLLEQGIKPLLAIDADPSSCLASALGVDVTETIGGIREDTRTAVQHLSPGMSKSEYLGMKIQEALGENDGFDFLAMGRPEGPGCYCFVNNVLRDHLDRLTQHYRATVIDCEAGLEHLSRRTTLGVSTMLFVADPTLKALQTLQTVQDIAARLNTTVKRRILLLNRVPPAAQERLLTLAGERLDLNAFEAVGFIPDDPAIFAAELEGAKLLDVSSAIPAYQHFLQIMTSLASPLWD